MKEREILRVDIKTRADKIPIWPAGDFHFGHAECDYEKLNRYVDWAKEQKDARIVLMGDLLETDIPTHMANKGVMWSLDGDRFTPTQQYNDLLDILKPVRKKILCAIMGNHEKRIYNLTNISLTEFMCKELDIPYLTPWPVYVDLNVNKINYKLLIAHGSGSSQRADYQIRKAINYYPSADLVLIGHIHYTTSDPFHKVIVDDGGERTKTIYGVRTGGFLPYPSYARESFMSPVVTGSPIVFLYTKKKIISPNTSDFVAQVQ
jgi:predicted phosphodiesterase